jgi:hypothetical protein
MTPRQPMPRLVKALLYVLGGLALAFGIVIVADWSPAQADAYTDWVTIFSYSVLWAWTISGIVLWFIALWIWRWRRKDDFKPWTPTGGKPMDDWTPPAGWKSDPYERED